MTTNSILQSCFEKLSVEASKSAKEIKQEISNVLELLKNASEIPGPDIYWPVLKNACHMSHSPKLRETALDSIQKLIARGIMVGDTPIQLPNGMQTQQNDDISLNPRKSLAERGSEPSLYPQNPILIDEVLDTVCNSYTAAATDEAVHLQVLKVILTAITGERSLVHGISLLKAIQACFLIHINSKNHINQTTAQASLTQMINGIFDRLESVSHSFNHQEASSIQVEIDPSSPNASVTEKVSPRAKPPISPTMVDNSVHTPEISVDTSSTAHLKEETERIYKDVFVVFRLLCRISMQQDKQPSENNPSSFSEATATAASVRPDEISAPAVRARILAFNLLLSVMNKSGHNFQKNAAYIKLIKQKLCLSISMNGFSANPTLFELSLSLFLIIIRHFRAHLKGEIEILFKNVFFHVLEMPSSTYSQKDMILQGFRKLAENPYILMDLFVNYDCDLEMSSIFERIVTHCTKIIQGKSAGSSFGMFGGENKSDAAKAQEKRLKLKSLACLVTIINSMVEWTSQSFEKSTDEQHFPEINNESTDNLLSGPDALLKRRLISANEPSLSTSGSAAKINALGSEIDEMALRKQLLKQAIKLFNTKPNKGMKRLIKDDFVQETPDSIAKFLLNTPDLAKDAIGNYIGEGEAFNKSVMHAMIDSLDFTNKEFVTALRELLQAFRLPGEAQKIDRIMEKFADRYCENNPDVFAKADTAYTLAYSIIMLNTDQHSTKIKHRMDKAAFIKNNRGINDNADLPDELLSSIFDDIHNHEIIMEAEQANHLTRLAISWGASDMTDQKRMELYHKEVALIQKKSHSLIKAAADPSRKISPFRSANFNDQVRPMFTMIAWPLTAPFTLLFDAHQDESENLEILPLKDILSSSEVSIVDLSLCGVIGAIQLSCWLGMNTERDAYISTIQRMTGLNRSPDLKFKNLKAIFAILKVADNFSEYLDSSWVHIIRILSQLELIQSIAVANEQDFAGSDPMNSKTSLEIQSIHLLYKTVQGWDDKVLSHFIDQSLMMMINSIFENTIRLSSSGIISHLKALAVVALEEVGLSSLNNDQGIHLVEARHAFQMGPPRTHLLQRVVEIACYNMHRIRYEWTQIWRVVQPLFNAVACHPNTEIATFSVESLRQLAIKYLERDELSHYTTQVEFLRSFEWIVRHSSSNMIKEMILSSLTAMINQKAQNIRSGWKSIFVVLEKIAESGENSEPLIVSSMNLLEAVYGEHLKRVIASGAFVDFVQCLSSFALLPPVTQTLENISARCLDIIQDCSNNLLDQAKTGDKGISASSLHEEMASPSFNHGFDIISSPRSSSGKKSLKKEGSFMNVNKIAAAPYITSDGLISEEHFFYKWFPILAAFAKIAVDSPSSERRSQGMNYLYGTLQAAAVFFDVSYWKNLLRTVIMPMFEELEAVPMEDGTESPIRYRRLIGKGEPFAATWIHGLRLLVELISSIFHTLLNLHKGFEVVSMVADLIISMMNRNNEKLATTGGICLHKLFKDNMDLIAKGNEELWEVILLAIESGSNATLPCELLRCEYPKKGSNTSVNVSEPDISVDKRGSSASDTSPKSLRLLESEQQCIEKGLELAQKLWPQALTLETVKFDHAIIKCGTHLEILEVIRDVCFWTNDSNGPMFINTVSAEVKKRLLQVVYTSYAVARAFNANYELRYSIWKKGLIQKLPNLVKQETSALGLYLRMLFALARSETSEPWVFDALNKESVDVLERFVEFLGNQNKYQRDISLWSPTVILIFVEMNHLEKHEAMQKMMGEYYRLATRIIIVDQPEVRQVLQEFFGRLGNLIFAE